MADRMVSYDQGERRLVSAQETHVSSGVVATPKSGSDVATPMSTLGSSVGVDAQKSILSLMQTASSLKSPEAVFLVSISTYSKRLGTGPNLPVKVDEVPYSGLALYDWSAYAGRELYVCYETGLFAGISFCIRPEHGERNAEVIKMVSAPTTILALRDSNLSRVPIHVLDDVTALCESPAVQARGFCNKVSSKVEAEAVNIAASEVKRNARLQRRTRNAVNRYAVLAETSPEAAFVCGLVGIPTMNVKTAKLKGELAAIVDEPQRAVKAKRLALADKSQQTAAKRDTNYRAARRRIKSKIKAASVSSVVYSAASVAGKVLPASVRRALSERCRKSTTRNKVTADLVSSGFVINSALATKIVSRDTELPDELKRRCFSAIAGLPVVTGLVPRCSSHSR